ncbi:MAG: hypothetical protein QOE51_3267 [Actinoplanes sp.]|nr:hypothetical protein [Actinoplanes sp.]
MYVELLTGGIFVEGADVRRYNVTYNHLRAAVAFQQPGDPVRQEAETRTVTDRRTALYSGVNYAAGPPSPSSNRTIWANPALISAASALCSP